MGKNGNSDRPSAELIARRLDEAVRQHQAGRLDEAQRLYQRILRKTPRQVDALHLLGVLRGQQGRYAEAAGLIRRALSVREDATHWVNLGLVLFRMSAFADAQRALRHALEMEPDSSEAANHLGMVLQAEGQLTAAEALYRQALANAPDDPEVLNNLGALCADLGRIDEAEACYRRTLAVMPGLRDTVKNLAALIAKQGRHEEAWTLYRHLCDREDDQLEVWLGYVSASRHLCRWDDLETAERRVREGIRREHPGVDAFVVLAIDETPAGQLAAARLQARRYAAASAVDAGPAQVRRGAAAIRVGYLSADYRQHPAAQLLPEVFRAHDRARFQVFAYSTGPDDGSDARRQIMESVDRFVDLQPLQHPEDAARIAADGIDILVDCSGYTRFTRPRILAQRPAPLQVNYLGYPGTLGADFVDYILVDPHVVPPAARRYYSESLVTLPDCYFPAPRYPLASPPPCRSDYGLPEDTFVFCCLNASYKITPRLFAVWMRLLQSVPTAVLWLMESNPWCLAHLRREAERRGVSGARLLSAERVPKQDHLSRFALADLFLDTHPYGAHTTASEALWAGLPVLTLRGQTFASRVCSSMLLTLGLPELVTDSLDDYASRALTLASDADALADLRRRLGMGRAQNPLFDTERYVRHLEAAYAAIWRRHAAGESPCDLTVPSVP